MDPITAIIGGLFGLGGALASKPKRSPLEQLISQMFARYSPLLANAYQAQGLAPGLSPQSQALANALNAESQRAGNLASRQALQRVQNAGFSDRGNLGGSALAAVLAGIGNNRLQQMTSITANDQALKNAALERLQGLITGQVGNAMGSYDSYAKALADQQQSIYGNLGQIINAAIRRPTSWNEKKWPF